MFALRFRFPAARYHATPWGRNVNEADVAWPPEPWRLLRALIATYWRKGDRECWTEEDLGRLIDALSETLPYYHLPTGSIHAHTRHYMPIGKLDKGREKTTLIFDAFVRLHKGASMVAAWPTVVLDEDIFALASDLASAIGYLGRAESWTECDAVTNWDGQSNCGPVDSGFSGDPVRLLAPLSPAQYAAERGRLIGNAETRIRANAKRPPTAKKLADEVLKTFRSTRSQTDTLPPRLVDAVALDTSDYQDRGWSRPPAGHEVIYARAAEAAPGVVPRVFTGRRPSTARRKMPTVARFLLAGRPLPRVEDSVKIGELMRLATLSQFGWGYDGKGRKIPKAPWQVSGRGNDKEPLRNPSHAHAFWLPEDADSDGLIDHISVFIADGIDDNVRAKLDRITRLWIAPEQRPEDEEAEHAAIKEWRLALEGFGRPTDFAGSARIFNTTAQWRSATPFMAAGHLKSAGHVGEANRLLKRRGFELEGTKIAEVREIMVGGAERRAIHFHRFRSHSREHQPDGAGTFLEIVFSKPIEGPLALGYGSHFGLGLFAAED